MATQENAPVYGATVEEIVPILPAGVYNATFEGIAAAHNDQGSYWLWSFRAERAEGDYVMLSATSSPRITPRTKAAKWLLGMGQVVDVGSEIDFGSLIGMPLRLVVIISPEGYSRIDAVIPYPKQ